MYFEYEKHSGTDTYILPILGNRNLTTLRLRPGYIFRNGVLFWLSRMWVRQCKIRGLEHVHPVILYMSMLRFSFFENGRGSIYILFTSVLGRNNSYKKLKICVAMMAMEIS